VSGTYDMPHNDPNQLINQLNLPVMTVTNAVARSALTDMTLVLPVYHVNLVPSPKLPGSNSMLTVKVAEVPAEMPVLVPVNIASTPQTADRRQGDPVDEDRVYSKSRLD
jgi:hypothetical protein